ncbi:aldolase [Aspergillus nidulans var. acristatus]
MDETGINLLKYLRSKTQVDLDTFDITAVGQFGQCVDCTSNQYEYYTELAKPSRKDILQRTIEVTAGLHGQFSDVTFDELGVEVGAVLLAAEMVPAFTGNLHLMVNPNYAYSRTKVVEAAKRFYRLFALINPSFPSSRLVIKVPATWEGLQACHDLQAFKIKTLGTTLFSMEQAILAGEAGCVSISPFVHSLRILVDPEYKDPHPVYYLSAQAQRWYRRQSLPTKVKSCSTVGVDELLELAGIDALTIVPDDLRALQSTYRDANEVSQLSIVRNGAQSDDKIEHVSYIDDEERYRADFEKADEGRAKAKTAEAIDIFCGYQSKAEDVVRKARGQ